MVAVYYKEYEKSIDLPVWMHFLMDTAIKKIDSNK